MKKVTIAISTIFVSSLCVGLPLEHSPRVSPIYDYEIGGAYIADAPTNINSTTLLEIGAGWNSSLQCGQMNSVISIRNQLNSVTDGFRNMMGGIVQNASAAVTSLPGAILQRSNPGLYEFLQQGILQGKLDFQAAQTSCEQMQNVLMGEESFPFEQFKLSIRSKQWSEELSAAGGDAVAAKQALDNSSYGDDGAEWACGEKRGGVGQQSIRALSDVVLVGYNILFDRANVCNTGGILPNVGQGTPLWEYWSGPVAAQEWATKIIGDFRVRTCSSGCRPMETMPGKGLTYMHREMRQSLESDIEDLVTGTTSLTWQHLNRVSAPPGVQMNDAIINAIRKRDALKQGQMIRKIAGEIAYARLIEQGRLLTQMLRTGLNEPNIASFQPAKMLVHDAIDQIQMELDQLDREITTRKSIAQNTIGRILGLEEKRVQSVTSPHRTKPVGTTQFGHP